MMEGHEYRASNIFFFIVFTYTDALSGSSKWSHLAKDHIQYKDINNPLTSDNYSNG